MKSSYPEFVGADESSRLYREVCAAVLFGSCACVVGACSRNSPASRVMKVVLPIGRVGFVIFNYRCTEVSFCCMDRNFFWQGRGLYWQRVMTVIRSGETYVAFDSSAEVQCRRAVRRALRKAASMGIGGRSAGAVFP